MSRVSYPELSQRLGYRFNNMALLEDALTHRSIKGANNERLEFLGDSIVNFVIAAALYEQCPQAKEGELSRLRASLVRGDTLAELAQEFNLGHYLRLGAGEMKSGGWQRKSILADAMEAVIAAIYLDADLVTCQQQILRWFEPRLANCLDSASQKDPKSHLQEHLQAKKMALPVYEIINITGEAHQQVFHVQCTIAPLNIDTMGIGNSRREAEQLAAQKALALIGK